MPSSLRFLAEQGSCWSAPDCELRLPRGTGMAAEVAVARTGGVACLRQITGTITELSPQSLTALELSPWMSLMEATVDRLDLERLVQQATRL